MVGVSALGIIGLMSFLIGVVIAQQGAVQLRQFGAEVYTINLVGRITLRELGILMTAIMVAGRSGSAFAAQIGTMKLTEEIDAMRTIAGCFQGMQVEGDAEQVGRRTTTAVVQAIFLVIVLDAFFAVFFSQIGWIWATPPPPRRTT